MAEDECLFLSPESDRLAQVMSPSRSIALLEGEVRGPNYGAVDAGGTPPVLANGVPAGEDGVGSLEPAVDGSCTLEAGVSSSGISYVGASAAATGLDGATCAQGVEARVTRNPPKSICTPPRPLQQPAAQPPQSSTQPFQPGPPAYMQQHSTMNQPTTAPQTFAPLQQQAAASGQPYAVASQSMATSSSQVPIQITQVDPTPASPPMQAMRSFTAHMATAAAAVGQRMQLQTTMTQGRVEVHGGEDSRSLSVGADVVSFEPPSNPPLLPQHLRGDHAEGLPRPGVLAGLARAGQAIRRRVMDPMLHHVSRSPGSQPQLSSNIASPGDSRPGYGPGGQEDSVFPSFRRGRGHERVDSEDFAAYSGYAGTAARA